MVNLKNFNEESQKAIVMAESIAFDLGNNMVEPEHLFLALLKMKKSNLHRVMKNNYNVDYQTVYSKIDEIFGKYDDNLFNISYSKKTNEILRKATNISKTNNENKVSLDCLTIATLTTKNTILDSLIEDVADTTSVEIIDNLNHLISLKQKIGIKLEEDKIDYAIVLNPSKEKIILERDKEVMDIIVGLSCHKKANIALTGKPGVGKSAVVEELARIIRYSNLSCDLKDYEIITLELNNCIAGTKYRGDFEAKIQKYLNCIEKEKVITFIDEGHQITTIGQTEGSVSISEIIKPILARGDYKFIIATTDSEFCEIKKDGALMRRFREVHLEEPKKEKVKDMIAKQVEILSDFHKISISDKDIDFVIEKSSQIKNRFFPDKAIDIIDYTMSYSKILKKKNFDIDIAEKYMTTYIEEDNNVGYK